MKKIILSLAIVGIVGAVVIGATTAYFSDSATSSDNTFTVGTLDLKLSDDNETDQDGITASFGGTNLKPGDVLLQQSIIVKNVGSIDAHHLDFQITLDPGYDPALADAIIFPASDPQNGMRFGFSTDEGDSINILTYLLGTYDDRDYDIYRGNGVSIWGALAGDPEISLADIVALGKIRIVPKPGNEQGLIAGTAAMLWIHPQIDTDLTAQGGTATANFNWTLEQNESQF